MQAHSTTSVTPRVFNSLVVAAVDVSHIRGISTVGGIAEYRTPGNVGEVDAELMSSSRERSQQNLGDGYAMSVRIVPTSPYDGALRQRRSHLGGRRMGRRRCASFVRDDSIEVSNERRHGGGIDDNPEPTTDLTDGSADVKRVVRIIVVLDSEERR